MDPAGMSVEDSTVPFPDPAEPNANEISPATAKTKSKDKGATTSNKRRCVSTACIACRRRKSKCDGAQPACAACSSVYMTPCEYAPHTDHRRKGVYKKDVDNMKTKNSTLQTLIHAILNLEEDEAFDLVREIRTCDNLEELAQTVENREKGLDIGSPDSPIYGNGNALIPQFEAELSGRMGDLVLDGSVKFIGGTSNLIWLNDPDLVSKSSPSAGSQGAVKPREEAVLNWTTVTSDKDLILHLINMYFCWHYAYFTTLSKELFHRDFLTGTSSQYCSPFLVNVMLALGCHFSSKPTARADPEDAATTGDHFFREAKRFLHENDEFATPKLCTVQALALMSVREAGCGRESKGWVYSGMSFRMASDLGLNVDADSMNNTILSDEEVDARRITYWGCFFFDKCWSNYLGRQPQLLTTNFNVKKPVVFPSEDSEMWSPYTDTGIIHTHTQPARTRAVALEIFKLAEISSDLLSAFYQPQSPDKPLAKQAELKKLSDLHTRLEAWKKELSAELDPKDGQLPQVLLMHMFYQLLYIHLYRPFLKYTKATSPLPAHVSPRKFCTQAAGAISKLFRLYKRTHGLRQICNIAVYIAHSACTIHLLNLPDKNAKRDIVHGLKQLEEIGESWTCARRTLRILGLCAEKWKIELPEEAYGSLTRTQQRWNSIEPTSPPVSADTATTLAQQVKSQPVFENLADKLRLQLEQQQKQQQHQLQLRQQDQELRQQQQRQKQQPSLSEQVGLSPQSHHSHMSSSVHSPMQNFETTTNAVMPQMQIKPQPSMDSIRNATRLRPFTQMTKAQQDAWNAHQAKMAGMNNNNNNNNNNMIPRSSMNDTPNNAAVLFGGVDTLVEEPQDWWFNDQSQLALGFDNWTSPATTDWSLGLDMGNNNSNLNAALANSSSFYNGDVHQPNGYSGAATAGGAAGGIPRSQHHQQQQQHMQRHPGQQIRLNAEVLTPVSMTSGGNRSTAQKRMGSFDDDDDSMFY